MKEIVSNFGFSLFLCFTSSVYAVALFKSSYKLLAFQCKHLDSMLFSSLLSFSYLLTLELLYSFEAIYVKLLQVYVSYNTIILFIYLFIERISLAIFLKCTLFWDGVNFSCIAIMSCRGKKQTSN